MDERCQTGGAENGSQPASDMRSEGLWRRGGGEWRVAVLRRRRVAAAHADARRAPALSSRPCPSRPRVLAPRFVAPSLLVVVPVGCPSRRSPPTLLHIYCVIRRARDCKMRGEPAKLGCETRRRCLAFLTLGGEKEQREGRIYCRLYVKLSRFYCPALRFPK